MNTIVSGPSHRIRLAVGLALVLLVCLVGGSLGSDQVARDSTRGPAAALNGRAVVAISVDGLNSAAITRLGRARLPNLHRMIYDQGAATLNARSQVEMTVTLPNHTSMVTGRPILRTLHGHGVTWNDDSVKRSVQAAAGHDVSSVFEQVARAGGRTAVYATKTKFRTFERSWPSAISKNVIMKEKNGAVTKALRDDLARAPRAFSFLHLGLPDQMGHAYGWMSAKYLQALEYVDTLVGTVMTQVARDPDLRNGVVLVLTSDHGGVPGSRSHSDTTTIQDYRVPFVIWGAGVQHRGLYALNPGRRDPGATQPALSASAQPIRNGEVANLSLDLLGLGPVPGSRWDRAQDLRWN